MKPNTFVDVSLENAGIAVIHDLLENALTRDLWEIVDGVKPLT